MEKDLKKAKDKRISRTLFIVKTVSLQTECQERDFTCLAATFIQIAFEIHQPAKLVFLKRSVSHIDTPCGETERHVFGNQFQCW